MGTVGLVVLATSRTWLSCNGLQSEGLVHWFFQVWRNLFYHSDATTLSSNWNAVQWKRDIHIYPQFKRQYFLQTIENSNLLTNFMTDFTNLSLKLISLLSRVMPRSSISSWIGITVPSQVNTGFLSTLPKVIYCLIFWMISFHFIEFIPLINLFQIGIYGMFNLVDIFRRLKQLSVIGMRE